MSTLFRTDDFKSDFLSNVLCNIENISKSLQLLNKERMLILKSVQTASSKDRLILIKRNRNELFSSVTEKVKLSHVSDKSNVIPDELTIKPKKRVRFFTDTVTVLPDESIVIVFNEASCTRKEDSVSVVVSGPFVEDDSSTVDIPTVKKYCQLTYWENASKNYIPKSKAGICRPVFLTKEQCALRDLNRIPYVIGSPWKVKN